MDDGGGSALVEGRLGHGCCLQLDGQQSGVDSEYERLEECSVEFQLREAEG